MAELLPGRRALSSFENQDTLSSIRAALNENAKNTLEVVANTNATPNTADYYPTGILKQVGAATTSGVYYPTVVIADYSDIIPETLTTSNVVITETGTFQNIVVNGNGTFAGNVSSSGTGTFDTIKTSTLTTISTDNKLYIAPNKAYWIETNRGYIYTETAYTSIIHGERNGVVITTSTNSTTGIQLPVSINAPFYINKGMTVSGDVILGGQAVVGSLIAQICFAGTAPVKNTTYNLWVNTTNQTMSYRVDRKTATWTALGAVFK